MPDRHFRKRIEACNAAVAHQDDVIASLARPKPINRIAARTRVKHEQIIAVQPHSRSLPAPPVFVSSPQTSEEVIFSPIDDARIGVIPRRRCVLRPYIPNMCKFFKSFGFHCDRINTLDNHRFLRPYRYCCTNPHL